MILPKTRTSATRARALRKRSTPAEAALWKLLRARQLQGLKFRRQVPCGHYILDFYCAEQRLVVEVDGGHHASRSAYDEQRSRDLAALELHTLRFSNDDVLLRPEAVVRDIRRSTLAGPHPGPLPQGEGGPTNDRIR